MTLFSKKFLVDTAERATKTFAQVVIGVFGADASSVANVNWKATLTAAAYAAVVSVVTSVASTRVGSANSASLVD